MPTDLKKLNYTSQYPIDKIVYEVVDTPLSYSVGGGVTTTQTIPNPYGQRAFTTMSWSVDGTNYYPAQAVIAPTNPYTSNAWCDESNIYIYLYNSTGSTVNFRIKLTLDTIE